MEREKLRAIKKRIEFYDPNIFKLIIDDEINLEEIRGSGLIPNQERFEKYMSRRNHYVTSSYRLYGNHGDDFVFSNYTSIFILRDPFYVTRLLVEIAKEKGIYILNQREELGISFDKLMDKLNFSPSKEEKSKKYIDVESKNSKSRFNKMHYDDVTNFLGDGVKIEISDADSYLHANSDKGECLLLGRKIK